MHSIVSVSFIIIIHRWMMMMHESRGQGRVFGAFFLLLGVFSTLFCGKLSRFSIISWYFHVINTILSRNHQNLTKWGYQTQKSFSRRLGLVSPQAKGIKPFVLRNLIFSKNFTIRSTKSDFLGKFGEKREKNAKIIEIFARKTGKSPRKTPSDHFLLHVWCVNKKEK